MHLRARWVALAHLSNKPASGRHGSEPMFSDSNLSKKSLIASSMYEIDLTREIHSLKVVRVLSVNYKATMRSRSPH